MKGFKGFLLFFVLTFALIILVACNEQGNHEHKFGEWSTAKAATCTEDGLEERSCSCGEKETRKIDATDHSWSAWNVTKQATCSAKGEESRTCSKCGEVEKRDLEIVDHELIHVNMTAAKTTTGTIDYYECKFCHKLFNSKKEEISLDSLSYTCPVESFTGEPLVATLNKSAVIQIYDGSTPIDKGDINDCYVIAIVNGKIIYASRYGGAGYGGPSDGFYHDGSYNLVPGSVCGIFDVDENFAPWPATATVNGEQVDAWSLYDIKVPEGGYIIATNRDSIKGLIIALTGYSAFATEEDNAYFEELEDGALNDIVSLTIVKGDSQAVIYAKSTAEGMEYTGSVSGMFDKQEDGTYKARITLEQWGRVAFMWHGEDGITEIWYDNTTFSGDVTAADKIGADWTYRLYHENDKVLLNCLEKAMTYDIVYNPTEKTLVVTMIEIEEEEPDKTANNYVLDGTTKVAVSEGVTIYDSQDTDIQLGEYTIAIDGTGKVMFASRTSSGYGGPSDGFYHDGNYTWVAGESHYIFSLDSEYAPWPNTATVNGETVNAWRLFTVVCPTDWHIITGSQAAMSNLIKALCNIETFGETDNSLFETRIADGAITTLITFEYNE